MRRLIVTMAIALIALPAWAAGTDQETAQQIADSLRNSGRMKGYSIAVKYKEGTARLEGTVRSQQQLEQALEIVNRTPEVKRVINNLTIDPGPSNVAANEQQPQAQQPQQAQAAPNTFRGGFFRRLTGGSEPSPARNGDAPTAAEPQRAPRSATLASNNVPAGQPTLAQPAVSKPSTSGKPLPISTSQAAQPQGLPPVTHPQPLPANALPQGQPLAMQGQPMQGQPMPAYAPGPMPVAYRANAAYPGGYPGGYGGYGGPLPENIAYTGAGTAPAVYDQPHLPPYAWPGYAAYPNYAALTYPKQYSPTAWPYIGPFYPYPQVPLGWRKVTLEWDDGWWFLNFADDRRHCGHY
jgi:hypothetical protein